MTIVGFLVTNFRDAERRLGRLTERTRDDQGELWRVVDESAIGRMLAWVLLQCHRAQPTSFVMSAWRRAVISCEAHSPIARMRMTGVVMLVAAVVHLGLAASVHPVGGWWLIVPGLAATFGVVAIVLSWLSPAS